MLFAANECLMSYRLLEEEENQDKKSEKCAKAKIHTENIKNVRRNIFPTSTRSEETLRAERMENITGRSQTLPERGIFTGTEDLALSAEDNFHEQAENIFEPADYVAHKTKFQTPDKLAKDTNNKENKKNLCETDEQMDRNDPKEDHQQEEKRQDGQEKRQDGRRTTDDDTTEKVADASKIDPTDSSADTVEKHAPHQRNDEWIEVRKRKSKK